MTTKQGTLWGAAFVLAFSAWILAISIARADDPSWSGHFSDWYKAQKVNPEAKERLGISWSSCCENSDVVKTKFLVIHSDADVEWWWLNQDRWDKVPDDIIHWNDPTPTGQPILFVYSGTPTCFYPGDSGG